MNREDLLLLPEEFNKLHDDFFGKGSGSCPEIDDTDLCYRVVRAQLSKVLKWLEEPCVHTAWNTVFDAKLHHKDDAGLPCYLHRKDCPKCWQRAIAIVPEKE